MKRPVKSRGIRLLSLTLCVLMILSLFAGCGNKNETPQDPATQPGTGTDPAVKPEDPPEDPKPEDLLPAFLTEGGSYGLKAAVVCYKPKATPDSYLYLTQPTLLGFETDLLDFSKSMDYSKEGYLNDYDLLYLDETLAAPGADTALDRVRTYVEEGGYVMVPNGLYDCFDIEFFGGGEFVRFSGSTADLEAEQLGPDLTELSGVVADFAELYKGYDEYDKLASQDYGWGIRGGNITPMLTINGVSAYAMCRWGEGTVFLTNPLLPNYYMGGSFTMKSGKDAVGGFSNSTASFNMLIYNGFAKYVSKQKYGFAMEKVYGYFGSPAMSWELHIEEITGIEHEALITFGELCKEYSQVPSFTVVRNSYQWFLKAESVNYLLNEDRSGGYSFEFDLAESVYSSGKHVAAGGKWIKQSFDIDETSYFVDDAVHKNMAFPSVSDYDGDGKPDLFCGSRDGQIYYYHGLGTVDGRFSTEAAQIFCDSKGRPLTTAQGTTYGYSSPVFFDVNGDGLLDMVSGAGDGKLYWAKCQSIRKYDPFEVWLDTGIRGQVMARFADMNGDKTTDLIIGSDTGKLMIYYTDGTEPDFYAFSRRILNGKAESLDISSVCANADLGRWLCPAVCDWNGDGREDIVLGTYLGYVAVLVNNQNNFKFLEFVTGSETNYKGNKNIKFGNYACPFMADLNGDGRKDLVVGLMEYGLAYPIDDPCFPFKDRLQEQIDYCRDRDYYLGMHFYTTTGSSAEREAWELAAHRKALEDVYNVDLSLTGANQHTWYTSAASETQTQLSIWNAGLLWQSGFASADGFVTPPQYAEENVVDLPFFLVDGGKETLLIQNNGVLLYTPYERSDMSAKYRMPMSLFYHCDFCYQSDVGARSVLQNAESFRRTNGYVFCREDQMSLASAAVIKQTARAEGALLEGGFKVSSAMTSSDFPLYDKDVAGSLGARICFAECLDAKEFSSDSNIWYREGNDMVVSLDKTATIRHEASAETRLRQVNMAAGIAKGTGSVKISFLSGGMMQAVVTGKASTKDHGWTVTEFDGKTMFTKYSGNETLNIKFE
ncbi:MAG: VCBS repeat-containing protein [Firmicutes bacterium]|nr:VCBS repeat-containing protein [Bacillota bacterium]MBQ6259739.1 VCBS repeat-containing protein [Bacillota bacterium]